MPRYFCTLQKCVGKKRLKDFGKKDAALVDDGHGNPSFAELVLIDKFRAAGWESLWFSAFGRVGYIKAWAWNQERPTYEENIPTIVKSNLDSVAAHRETLEHSVTTGRGGIPDVIAWRGDDILFMDCKRSNKDRLQETQIEWLHCARAAGLSELQLGIFEWDY